MPKLYLDTETYSAVPITAGTHKYAENAEIIMWQYAIDDGNVVVSDYLTDELRALLLDEDYEIVIHNSHFDRTIIRHCAQIDIPVNRIFDTMVCALAHSLPGGLDVLCSILGVAADKAKDKEGKKLISLFCKPQKDRKGNISRATRSTHPEEWAKFCHYGDRDITAMRAIYKMLPQWNYRGFERKAWEWDQKVNDRGICIDVDLARGALRAATRAQKDYAEETVTLTDGAVSSTNRREKVIEYIANRYNLKISDLTRSNVSKLLDDENLPLGVKELLSIRLDSSKTSTAKYKRVLAGISIDGRLRGILQFCGASRTGRWAGRLFQPQNLPRPTIKDGLIEQYIQDIKRNAEGLLSADHTVMEMCSNALRGLITVPPGKKLVVADLSNIEGRVLAWLSGENWKVKAFKDFDNKKGHDLYVLTYSKTFGTPVENVTSNLRQIGKVMELAFGYQGGIGAWITFSLAYRIDLEELANKAYPNIPRHIIDDAERFLEWHKEQDKNTYGLSDKAFIVCDSIKRMWRAEHPFIQSYWSDIENACKEAITHPGCTIVTRFHKIAVTGSWLRIQLPSGRYLCYPQPELTDGKISYMGMNQYTRKWERIQTYGGKFVENITQAVSRDIVVDGGMRAETVGFETVLSVHDELLAEVPDTDDYNVSGLVNCMTTIPIWATGLPLAAAGFETHRYKK